MSAHMPHGYKMSWHKAGRGWRWIVQDAFGICLASGKAPNYTAARIACKIAKTKIVSQ